MTGKVYPVINVEATGRNIVRLRKARGLSVAELQDFLGFEAPQAIYKWQSGKNLPSTDNLYALSVLFEVTIEDIIIPIKPVIQVLPQEESCGSHRFGTMQLLSRELHMGIFPTVLLSA